MRLGSLWPALVITMVLLAGWPAALAQTATPAGPGQPQKRGSQANPAGPGGITFWRGESIYYLPPGSKQPHRLGPGRFPALSPDSKRLAYRSEKQTAPDGQKGPEESRILAAQSFQAVRNPAQAEKPESTNPETKLLFARVSG